MEGIATFLTASKAAPTRRLKYVSSLTTLLDRTGVHT